MFVVILGIIHGFYSDVVECWLQMLDVPGSIFGRGKRYLAFFTCYHSMAWNTSVSKIDSWNV